MNPSRPSPRTTIVGCALIAFAVLVAGFLASTPQVAEIAHAAACKTGNGYFQGTLPYDRTAAGDVTYIVPGGAYSTPVEPTGDTDRTITAYWNTAVMPCQEFTDSATVTVSWSGTSWTLLTESPP